MKSNCPKEIPILSFFSGAGFLDIGFLKTGKFCIPWHNECHKPFADAYEHGVSKLGYNSGSEIIQSRARMENLQASAVMKAAFGAQRSPRMFGVIGGPPCPDFSRAGQNQGYNGKNGKLTRNFANMIRNLRPSFFLIENVPGLLETKKHRAFFFQIMKRLGKDYAVDLRILNALQYGVPQSRRRVFVVGIRLDWIRRCRRQDYKRITDKSREIIGLDISAQRSAREVVADIAKLNWFKWPSEKYPHPAQLQQKHGKIPQELRVGYHFAKINGHPNGQDTFRPYSAKFYTIKPGDVSGKSFKRLHNLSYSPNAAYGNNEVHLHPEEHRRISVAEALAIQSVPKEYCFPANMTLTDKFKAVGNGVPVLLAERVANSLAQFLRGK